MVDSTELPEVDINAIATDLNNKADRDLVNLNDTGLRELYFLPGDTYSFTAGKLFTCGFLSNAQKTIYFSIPLPKKVSDNVSNVTMSRCIVSLRHVSGGYVTGLATNLFDYGTIALISKTAGNQIYVAFNLNSAFTAAPNNTPVTGEIAGLTLTFS